MSAWSITVDQRTPSGSSQRHGPRLEPGALGFAIENALDHLALDLAEVGSFQITASLVATDDFAWGPGR